MNLLFDSGLLDFAVNEAEYIEVRHNLNKCPAIVYLEGNKDGVEGFPMVEDVSFRPYITMSTDTNILRVFKSNSFNFTGKFRVRIFE